MGASTAYHLALLRRKLEERPADASSLPSSLPSSSGAIQDPPSHRRIVVVEQDPTYQTSSATLSAGGIRQQFSLTENVQMSLYGRDFLRQAHQLLQVDGHDTHYHNHHPPLPPDVQFQEHGYLFLASNEAEAAQLERNHQIQLHAGCRPEDMTLLSPSELAQRFPWMNTDDLLLGSLGVSGEGWFDPWALLQSFYHKNRSMGVEYWHGSPQAARRNPDTGMIEAVQLLDHSSSSSSGGGGGAAAAGAAGRTEWVRVNQVVNAAGPFAEDVVRTLVGEDVYRDGLHVPVKPRKRSVFFLHCAADQTSHPAPDICPLTVDPYQGVYIRTEGSPGQHRFLCGVSPPCEEDVDCEDTTQAVQEGADHHLWEDCIWPALYHRIPALEAVKVMSSWAGLYDYNTIDQNAIIDWYGPNLLLVNGFSGHGLQHSPAAGRAAAELLDLGHFETLNLDVFSLDRLKPATTSASASASASGSTGSTKDHHLESDESISPPPIAVGRNAPPSVLHETGIV